MDGMATVSNYDKDAERRWQLPFRVLGSLFHT
jgi:hypothetical protein